MRVFVLVLVLVPALVPMLVLVIAQSASMPVSVVGRTRLLLFPSVPHFWATGRRS